MGKQRTHHVTTTDGVSIGGTVHGEGPPLVFLQGFIGDGNLDWEPLLEFVTDRFTCHLPSLRGRGLSGDHPDHDQGRMVDDVLAYLDSLEARPGLVGWSGGAGLALLAAAQSEVVNGVVAIEPGMMYLMDEQERALLGGAIADMNELASEGRWAAAARAFAAWPFNDDELSTAEEAGYFEASGRYVPTVLTFIQQNDPTKGDPGALGAVRTPVLVLHGGNTKPFFVASAQHVVDHARDARIRQVQGAGHAVPLTHPEALAEALVDFFPPRAQAA